MRFFLCRIGTRPVRLLFMLLACHILACGDKAVLDPQVISLNTTSHEQATVQWQGTTIQADVKWRFISAEESLNGQINISGAWTITFTNTGNDTYVINITRLVFEDAQGFQLAEYTRTFTIDEFTLAGSQTQARQGNFQFVVASIDMANKITKMNVYARISQR